MLPYWDQDAARIMEENGVSLSELQKLSPVVLLSRRASRSDQSAPLESAGTRALRSAARSGIVYGIAVDRVAKRERRRVAVELPWVADEDVRDVWKAYLLVEDGWYRILFPTGSESAYEEVLSRRVEDLVADVLFEERWGRGGPPVGNADA